MSKARAEVKKDQWLFEISPKRGILEIDLKEIWSYRDLLLLFVKRDIATVYKQTVLGPLWFLVQPLLTSVIFTLIFNNLAGISTGAVPSYLFNLAGVSMWNYFRECLTTTSSTFTANQGIFSKVYFPRVIVPLSKVTSNLVKFGIQLVIFIAFYIFFVAKGAAISPNMALLAFPLLIIAMAMYGLGFGMILTSLTTKYRDLTHLISFGVQLLMYVSAVMYPIAEVKQKMPNYAWLVAYNPLALVIEGFRYMTLGEGSFAWASTLSVFAASIVIFMVGLLIFNKTEQNFIDTV